jgi:hypothetical protein
MVGLLRQKRFAQSKAERNIKRMNGGELLRQGFETLFNQFASTVDVFRDYGKASQNSVQMKAMKSNEKRRLDKVMFEFLDRADVRVGDVIQQKGSRDLWSVTEVEDIVEADVFLNIQAKVVRLGTGGTETAGPKSLTIGGSVFGAIQINSPNSTQSVSVAGVSVIQNDVDKLKELLRSAALSDFKTEEGILILDRLNELAKRGKSPEVMESAKDKLEFLSKLFATVSSASSVALKAGPYIREIARQFGLT